MRLIAMIEAMDSIDALLSVATILTKGGELDEILFNGARYPIEQVQIKGGKEYKIYIKQEVSL